MLEVSGTRVAVIGLGASGRAACRLLVSRGAAVVGNDLRTRAMLGAEGDALEALGVSLVSGHHELAWSRLDMVVLSPGVPAPEGLLAAEAQGLLVVSEVELAFRAFRPCPVVAVGGTNGKSTTTSLVGALLSASGRRVFLGGNLGEPWSAHVDEDYDAVVVEVSSFQLERVNTFRPHVSVLLNISPDHMDRYPSLEAYAGAKGNAFVRQGPSDWAVVPSDDPVCRGQAERGQARILRFGLEGDVDMCDDALVDHGAGVSYPRADIALKGRHNMSNVAAALLAVRPFDVAPSLVRKTLHDFAGLPHRMAWVAEHCGVAYYNDSKGTNVGASVMALVGLSEPRAVLLAGGREKGGSYEPLAAALRDRGRAAVVFGEAADAMERAFAPVLPVVRAADLQEAVAVASRLAKPGDAVLLSPACSSYDMFRDYTHRGDAFVRAVHTFTGVRDASGSAEGS